jgi:hypothetical protein
MVERYIPEYPHLFEGEQLGQWIDALVAIDVRDDKLPLIKLLRENIEMPWPISWHLADLLDRYSLAKRASRGGRIAPSYDNPPALRKLVQAKKYYQRYVREDRATAYERAAEKCGVDEEKLRAYVEGKYASARRVKKRKPPPNPRQ